MDLENLRSSYRVRYMMNNRILSQVLCIRKGILKITHNIRIPLIKGTEVTAKQSCMFTFPQSEYYLDVG